MIDYVIDANVLISFLISGKAQYKTILRNFHFIAPEFILAEVKEYADEIIAKTKLGEDNFRSFSMDVFKELTILPEYFQKGEHLLVAHQMLGKIDLKDIHYLALSLQLDVILLTRDKPLYKGLRKQGFRKVMLLEDFLKGI